MTVKLVVLYTQPDDHADFDAHYHGAHRPLVQSLPGLQAFATGTISPLDGGEETYYRYAELTFADEAAMRAAFGSAEGDAAGQDYGRIAPPGSRMLTVVIDG
jgi:uncharacterized protein (TIGR02118 family)